MSTHVLVIEDNPADFRLLKEALIDVNATGIDLTHCTTLRQAMERISGTTFDVVLLDLSLPDTDGLDGLRKLQQFAPDLPVLVLTGRNDSELAVQAVREGAQDYLVKGNVDGQLLVRAMRYAQERKQVLRQLKHSEQRFRSLLENASDIITVVGAGGTIQYASPSTERVLGYKPEELLGTPVLSLVMEEDRPIVIKALGGTEMSQLLECRVRRKDGVCRVLEAAGRWLLDDPSINGIVVNARDITERKAAESQLRQANERLRAVIETSPLPIYVLDLNGRVEGWNMAAERVFGWSETDVLGGEPPMLSGRDQDELRERLALIRDGITIPQVDTRYRRRDGSALDVSIWNSPLRDDAGRVTGVVLVVADVTEKRRLEEQFQQAQKMEAVGRLAGGVAHDFNNLLTVITGYSQLASNRQQPGSQSAADLREVLNAADRAATLTRQLLALSRRQVVEPAILDVNTVVSDMERMLHRIIGEDVKLRTNLAPIVPPVRADRGQLELVLLNLAVNARDAMPNGGVLTIETGAVELSRADLPPRRVAGLSGPAVMIAVTDTGVGMDEKVRAHLFEPFYTTKEPGKGTGLGLSTSYGIIRQHGGDVWVYSEPGVGTAFKIYLPVAAEHAVPVEASRQPQVRAAGTETVLLVEDDESVARVMREALEMQGYRVLPAHEPQEALALARSYNGEIHLLLSDLVLQSMHGVELSHQIRAIRPGILVLYVSGYTGSAEPGLSFLEPGVRFLQKPFAPEVLVAKVREVLNEGTVAQGPAPGQAD